MKRFLSILFIFTAFTSFAGDADSLWTAATKAYSEGAYETALQGFKALEEQGYESPQLYYNIGNAYFKMDHHIAHSILYYERALRLNPTYQDALNNLELAKGLTQDRIDEVPEFVLITWMGQVKRALSSDSWAILTLLFVLGTALSVLMFRYGSRSWLKRLSFVSAIVFMAFAIVFFIFSLSLKTEAQREDEAVIVSAVSSVRSSPDQQGKSLLIIHEGTKVQILEELGEWRRVEISDGRQGWVKKEELEII